MFEFKPLGKKWRENSKYLMYIGIFCAFSGFLLIMYTSINDYYDPTLTNISGALLVIGAFAFPMGYGAYYDVQIFGTSAVMWWKLPKDPKKRKELVIRQVFGLTVVTLVFLLLAWFFLVYKGPFGLGIKSMIRGFFLRMF